jgi:hypothetical protein
MRVLSPIRSSIDVDVLDNPADRNSADARDDDTRLSNLQAVHEPNRSSLVWPAGTRRSTFNIEQALPDFRFPGCRRYRLEAQSRRMDWPAKGTEGISGIDGGREAHDDQTRF